MATLFFIALVVATFAAFGRGSTPRHERLPVGAWHFADVNANVRRGFRAVTPHRDRMEPILDGITAGVR
ncbi:hypothetical protein [Arthrobacter pigmenti]